MLLQQKVQRGTTRTLFLLLLLLLLNVDEGNSINVSSGTKGIQRYDDDTTFSRLRLEDLEIQQEQQDAIEKEQLQQQQSDLQHINEGAFERPLPPPRLPIRYSWLDAKALPPPAAEKAALTVTAAATAPMQESTPAADTSNSNSNGSKDVYESEAAASNANAYNYDANLERLRQLQLQHQQLSAGYALQQLTDGYLLVPPAGKVDAFAGIARQQRPLKPIVPYDDVLSEPTHAAFLGAAVPVPGGVQYLTTNALHETRALPPPPQLPPPPPSLPFAPQPLPQSLPAATPPYPRARYTNVLVPALEYGTPYATQLRRPLHIQSKQYAYAPARHHHAGPPRVPLPYPPSFISITTRRPLHAAGGERYGSPALRHGYYGHGSAMPFRPSQPDPTPNDLWANRAPKSLLDSYIPSWQVLQLMQQQQHQHPQQHQHHHHHHQPHTLAYGIPGATYDSPRLYKRDSKRSAVLAKPTKRKIIKKSLDRQMSAKDEQPQQLPN